MGSQHVGIYYDGVELGNAQNGQIDLGQLSLDNIQEIAVYNGQRSTLLQPASDFAHGGTVYIRTRQPHFSPGRPTHLKAKVQAGASGLLSLSTLWEQRLSDRLSVSLSAGWLSASGKYRFRYRRLTPDGSVAYDTTATRQNGDVRAERVELTLHGLLRQGFWTTKAYCYDSGRGIPGAIVNNVWRRGERQYDTNVFLQHRLQKDFGDRFSTQVLAKYAYYRTHYLDRDTTHLPVDNRYWQQEFYLSTSNSYQLLPAWGVSMSYDLRWNKLNADTYRFAFPTRLIHSAAVATALDLGPLRLQGSLAAMFVSDRVRRGTSAHLHEFMPAFFLNYYPFASRAFSVHAFAKRSFRMPTFNDLYYADMGNSKLNPEYVTQYDAGFAYTKTWENHLFYRFKIQADGYFNKVKDKIIAYPKGQQFRWTMLNLGKVEIKGIDVSTETTVNPVKDLFVTLRIQYTYQKAQDFTDPSDTYYGDQIPYIPWHSGSAIAQASFKGWNLNYSFIYVGERYNQQENIKYNYTQPWYTSDISLSKDLKFNFGLIKAAVEVNNLLSQDYDVILNYPMPKRNYKVSLTIEI